MKILILKPDHLGDFVLSLPVIWELVQLLGSREKMKVLVHPQNVVWETILPWLPQLEAVHHPRYRWNEGSILTGFGLIRQFYELRNQKFTHGVDLTSAQGDRWGKRLLKLAACPTVCGRKRITRGSTTDIVHETKLMAEGLPKEWGVRGQTRPEVFFPKVKSKLGDRTILLAPAARHSAKSWPSEKWRELKRRLSGHQVRVLVPPDVNPRVYDGWTERWECLTPSTIADTLHILRHCSVLVALDTAVAHYAWLVGLPVVQIFSGVAEIERWGCLAPGVKLNSSPPCAPCKQEVCFQPRHICMDDIPVQAVEEAICKLV